jgi:hypothetical protein
MLPMLSIPGSTLFATTTLQNQSAWSSQWLKADNNSIHNLLNFAEICNECLKLPIDQALQCNHTNSIIAGFVDSTQQGQIMALMDQDRLYSEMFNVLPQTNNSIWQLSQLEEYFSRKCSKKTFFDQLFFFCDPSMTGPSGSYTACALVGCSKDGEIVVYGISSQRTDTNTAIIDFITNNLKLAVETFQPRAPGSLDPNGTKFKIFASVEHNTVNHTYELIRRFAREDSLRDTIVFLRSIGVQKQRKTKQQKRWIHLRGGQIKRPNDELKWADICNQKFITGRFWIHPEGITTDLHGSFSQSVKMAVSQFANIRNVLKHGHVDVVSKYDANNRPVHQDIWVSLATAIANTEDCINPSGRFHDQYKDATPFYNVLNSFLNDDPEDDDISGC